ncbi:GNAT family N-acetyltransferase [Micromonospora cathayae]|uniref:GNAT family N-acetyltransferase n=1 Tax=Micromonospora cathayae TaxID=3028804 RepID=A0ABY7ZWF0_9ACTN|nr:GNAT family N-acetyltransferase [Micromonospora sp. HUAS 3]WDZ86711.1 GNAT family N-acetyltransferase [Micromonospora sp. HUAS 3]
MYELQRLAAHHATALLHFERENRAWFARSVPDRGDDYFTGFAARHTEILAEQAAGRHHFHLLVDGDGAVLGRVNLVDVDPADGSAALGFRVAERVTGRGVATDAVRRVLTLARDTYRLRRLYASATLTNAGSLGVLRATGFTPVGEVTLDGQPGLRHVRELTPDG